MTGERSGQRIAVLDTETNWEGALMSVGAVVAEEGLLLPEDHVYYALPEECAVGGLYEDALDLGGDLTPEWTVRESAVGRLAAFLREHGVTEIFAYNAAFDRRLLPELAGWRWYDIMRVAPYRRYNPYITDRDACGGTGRLKRYGVESVLRLMTGSADYREKHNALADAADELTIMRLLGAELSLYRAEAALAPLPL